MKHKITTICFLVVLIAGSAPATDRNVPLPYPTIQAAIEACDDFDTVIVAPGKYFGSDNRDINFDGKPITVRSSDPNDPQIVNATVIDCEGEPGFVFNTWETPDSTIAGLTIINAHGGLLGGAVSCSNSSPSIINCVFINNSATFGGAIACTATNTRPKITGCKIMANSASFAGGAIYCSNASPKITDSIIIANSAQYGGAIYSHNVGEPVITGCTITENTAAILAGGIYCYGSSNMTVTNTILWDNTAAEIFVDDTSIQLSYCDIQDPDNNIICGSGGIVNWGEGNIDADPYFVDPNSGDYHLLSYSQGIDGGDPNYVVGPGETDLDGNPRVINGRIDMGAFEFQLQDPAQLLLDLAQDVLSINLQQGISNSLDAKLEAALNALEDINQNNDVAAINALQAFINAVEAQRGNKIPEADADDLIAAAQEIIDLLSSE
ncbi:MAG: right-handed parallel beta-helix repeat-containing protein [Planctomycetota bacterium]|jgi:predicted outer membrane repeat protein